MLVGPLASAATVTLPHDLREGDRDVTPNAVLPDRATPIVVTGITDTTVSFRNDGTLVESAIFQAIRWHSIQEAQPLLIPPLLWQGNPGTAGAVPERSFLPESWEEQDVATGLTDKIVAATVSTLFDEVDMVRAGSLTGLTTRLTSAITAGALTVKVSINGAATAFTLVHTSVSNPSGGRATLAPGTVPFAPGDRVGILIDTTVGFSPTSTDLLVRVEVEV
jgi:hypothetical protein